MFAALISVVIKLLDLYLNTVYYIREIIIRVLALLCNVLITQKPGKFRILYAELHGKKRYDITTVVKLFYVIDTILSMGSLCTWLEKFGHKPESATLIMTFVSGGDVCVSRLNLDDDIELLTGEDSTDVELSKIRHKVIFTI